MGPLVSPAALQRMQSIMDKSDGLTFVEQFKAILNEMSPQNRRGFVGLIQLLSDLLDASGSDADRGVLIMSFSEALVLVGNPHDYITLLDRLVEDFETLFDEAIERGGSSGSTSSSLSRSRSYDKGSHNSKSSSFRKRFGFGGALNRENTKPDSESKVSSLLRTWSKGGKNSSDSKSLLGNASKVSRSCKQTILPLCPIISLSCDEYVVLVGRRLLLRPQLHFLQSRKQTIDPWANGRNFIRYLWFDPNLQIQMPELSKNLT